ncbi:MAG: polysaccharide biosynthesis tyrosine autokinase [Goleter apudmare HA4340-LM2]|jgi:capsular exopolysaccharide synthesis family protein|nr:polysaccharide biosynthesis tyrosine autokinase [Goleter apudmare HA4340-LM2]
MANTGLNQGQMVTTSSQSVVNIKQLPIILLRQRYLILGISCGVMLVAGLIAAINKPIYESNMQVLVSSNFNEGVSSDKKQEKTASKFTDPAPQVTDYTIQMKLMLSSKLIGKAVDLLRPTYPNITLENIYPDKDKTQDVPLTITQLNWGARGNRLASQILEIAFKNQDPVKAQRVLQALQKVYQDYNKEQQKERLNKGLAFVNARLPEIKQKVIQSQNKLEEFRKKHNLLDPHVQSKILLESLADIQKNLQTTSAQLQNVQAQYSNLKQKMASSSQNALISSGLAQSSRYQTLLNEIQKTELVLAQEQKRYTDASPKIQSLKQQYQSQLALLQQETKRFSEEKVVNLGSLEKPLSTTGQMLGVDAKLMEEIIQVQTKALGLIANEKSLIESEQKLRAELSKYPSLMAEYNRLLAEVETHRKTLEQLLQEQQLLGMKIAQGGFDWQVLDEPTPGTEIRNSRLLLLLGGVIAGLILGILTALIREKFYPVIYSAQELQKLTNIRLLGIVPKLRIGGIKKRIPSLTLNGRRNSVPLVLETNTKLPYHETLEIIYQNLQILKHPFPLKSLMLTSTLAGEGKTTLVLGFAASAAHMHQRVLVIDANLRRPSLHKILDLSNDWGLSLLLVDETNTHISDYIQPIHPSIDILTAGPLAEDAVKLLSSGRMSELIEFFEQTYDLVLIDAPAILGMVDASIIAPLCNGIVIVGRIGQVRQNELLQARDILGKLNLIGIIANDVK